MAKIITQLLERKEIAEKTMAFVFARPQDYEFKAGQNIDMFLVGSKLIDNKRTFSLAGAPQDETLMIATRLRGSDFKNYLKEMPLGTEISISEPLGSFTLHNNADKAAIFLIGGIGITPVRSILFDAANRGLSHQLYLFYSNQHPEDAPFLEELQALAQRNPNFHLIATMTDEAPGSLWEGEKGLIDEEMINRYVSGYGSAIWYLSGPKGMVKGMRKILENLNIDEDNIKTEEFSGY